MKVVLLEDIQGLGKAGDIVNVKDGYGRNFIIKNKKGLPGTKENIAAAIQAKKDCELAQASEKQAAEKLADSLSKMTITIKERAAENGDLYGSVTSKDIALALKDQKDLEIDKRKITLAEPLRHIGKAEVKIKTYVGVEGRLTVNIIRE